MWRDELKQIEGKDYRTHEHLFSKTLEEVINDLPIVIRCGDYEYFDQTAPLCVSLLTEEQRKDSPDKLEKFKKQLKQKYLKDLEKTAKIS